jgi:hypothetical protein
MPSLGQCPGHYAEVSTFQGYFKGFEGRGRNGFLVKVLEDLWVFQPVHRNKSRPWAIGYGQ